MVRFGCLPNDLPQGPNLLSCPSTASLPLNHSPLCPPLLILVFVPLPRIRLTGQPENVITTVQAVQGRALCFFHNIVHEGVAVAPGTTKYIIRSDLMYRRTPAVCDSPRDREAFVRGLLA